MEYKTTPSQPAAGAEPQPRAATTGQATGAQVENPKADRETQPQEPARLLARQIYGLRQLRAAGFRFARIKDNRDIDQRAVNKKMASIRITKGPISPLTVSTAKECIEAGLEVEDWAGQPVTSDTPDLDKVLVIIDGQHRLEALRKLDEKGEHYEAYFILPLTDSCDPMTLLKEANTSVNTWDGIDWLTMGIQRARVNHIDIGKLQWLKELANTDNISDSAASLYVTGGSSIISMTRSRRAIDKKDTDDLKQLADTVGLERNRELYKTIVAKVDTKTAGLKVLPQTLFGYIDEEVEQNVPKNEAHHHVIRFIDSLSSKQVKELKNAKKTTDKTKDQVIRDLLNTYWKAWNTNQEQ